MDDDQEDDSDLGDSDKDSDRLKHKSSRTDSSGSVRFEKLTFRNYPVVLGDNPSITSGPPISLDWQHGASYELSVEEYERSRPPRRDKKNMVLPKSVRQEWLLSEGYSRGEMREAEKVALREQKNRLQTAKKRLVVHVMEEKSEALGRTLKNILRRRSGGNNGRIEDQDHLYKQYKQTRAQTRKTGHRRNKLSRSV